MVLRFLANVSWLTNQKLLDCYLSWLLSICTFSSICDQLHISEWGRALWTTSPGISFVCFWETLKGDRTGRQRKGVSSEHLSVPCFYVTSPAGSLLLCRSVFSVLQWCVYPYPSLLQEDMASTSTVVINSWEDCLHHLCVLWASTKLPMSRIFVQTICGGVYFLLGFWYM